jgi:hypothetical protein
VAGAAAVEATAAPRLFSSGFRRLAHEPEPRLDFGEVERVERTLVLGHLLEGGDFAFDDVGVGELQQPSAGVLVIGRGLLIGEQLVAVEGRRFGPYLRSPRSAG